MKKEIITYNALYPANKFREMGGLGSNRFLLYGSGRIEMKTNDCKKSAKERLIATETIKWLRTELNGYEHSEDEKKRRNIQLKRKRILQRCWAMANTTAGTKRMNAITLTFPREADNVQRLKLLNTILTRWRQKLFNGEVFNYIWVKEQHKSGLFHYHIVTTNHIDYNRAYEITAETIRNECGVKNVRAAFYCENILQKSKDTKALAQYIAKLADYVAKCEGEIESGRSYGCSQSVSALFTSIVAPACLNDSRRGEEMIVKQNDNDFEITYYKRLDCWQILPQLVNVNDKVLQVMRGKQFEEVFEWGISHNEDYSVLREYYFVPPLE